MLKFRPLLWIVSSWNLEGGLKEKTPHRRGLGIYAGAGTLVPFVNSTYREATESTIGQILEPTTKRAYSCAPSALRAIVRNTTEVRTPDPLTFVIFCSKFQKHVEVCRLVRPSSLVHARSFRVA